MIVTHRVAYMNPQNLMRLSEEAEAPQTKVLKGNIAAHDVIDVSLELGQAPLEKGIAREILQGFPDIVVDPVACEPPPPRHVRRDDLVIRPRLLLIQEAHEVRVLRRRDAGGKGAISRPQTRREVHRVPLQACRRQ